MPHPFICSRVDQMSFEGKVVNLRTAHCFGRRGSIPNYLCESLTNIYFVSLNSADYLGITLNDFM